jgi:hypothetical protein
LPLVYIYGGGKKSLRRPKIKKAEKNRGGFLASIASYDKGGFQLTLPFVALDRIAHNQF